MMLFTPFRLPALVVFIGIAFPACDQKEESAKQSSPYSNAEIDVHIFRNDTTADSALGGYGYNIFLNKAMYVHQPHIPAINGNRGFSLPGDAEKTGALTAFKIRNNIMPPSLTVRELDSLGVLEKGYPLPPETTVPVEQKPDWPKIMIMAAAALIIGYFVYRLNRRKR